MKLKLIKNGLVVAGIQLTLHWATLGILRWYGFQVFESHSNSSMEPRVLPIHMLFVHLDRLLNYPLTWLPQPAWLQYSWFFTALLFAVNSILWGAAIGLLINRRPHAPMAICR